jgi:uncharacterized cupin superfamily protein
MGEKQRRHSQVINVDESEQNERLTGSRFGFRRRGLADHAGGKGIGGSWFEIPPGRTAFPYHFHCVNEEAMFVLEGEGTLRIGSETVAIRAGDWVSFPIGPEGAHQVTNSGQGPLRLLALSTKVNGDVVGYPDSKKIGALGSMPGTKFGETPWLRVLVREGSNVDYFDGEKID